MRKARILPSLPWGVLLWLIVAAVALYWPFLFGRKAVFWGTPLLQFWPWRRLAAEQLALGRMPLWNPYSGNGVPLLADHQSAVLYPPNFVLLLFPIERAMGLSLALHAILAGGAMYALARDQGISQVGGLVAGLAFMLSGYMVARGSFLTEVSALPWLPLLWIYGGRVLRRGRYWDVLALAGVTAVQFLAGHAQTWFYSMIALGLYALWQGVALLRRRTGTAKPVGTSSGEAKREQDRTPAPTIRTLAVRWALIGAAVLWGVGLAAIQFLPTAELAQAAGRSEGAGWETFALQYSLWPWRLITLLMPDFFGNPAQGDYWGYATYWEDAGHIGVFPFILALLGIVAWFRRRRQASGVDGALHLIPFFGLLAVLALLMALGKNTPFYMIFFRYVPGFRTFQAPARWLAIYTPAMALLAGVGIDALRPSQRLTFISRLGIAGGVAIAATTAIAQALLPQVKATFFGPLIHFSIWFIASLLLLLWGQAASLGEPLQIGRLRLGRPGGQIAGGSPWSAKGMFSAAVVLIVGLDLILAGRSLNPAIDPLLYASSTHIGTFLTSDGPRGRTFYFPEDREEVMFGRYLDFKDFGPSDLAHWWGLRESLVPDLGIVEHVPSANSFEPLLDGRYRSLLEALEEVPTDTALRLLGAMNVAYILSPEPIEGLERIYRSPVVDVYRNPYLMPRAYTLCQARLAETPDQALALLTSPDFVPAQEIVLEGPLRGAPLPQRTCDPGAATLLHSAPDQVTIRAVLPEPGYLVLADTYYPGWQALVDGQPREILRANYAFRAVPVSAGDHEVVFRYRPMAFRLGAALSIVSLLGAVVSAAYHWTRKRA